MSETVRLPAETVGNREIKTSDGEQIAPEKLWHQKEETCNFSTAIGGTPATREEILFVAKKAGTIDGVSAMLDDSGTSTNIDFDLKKNSVSILSAAINIVHGTGDRVPVAGTVSNASYADGDTISCAMTVTSATGAKGPTMNVVRRQRGAS